MQEKSIYCGARGDRIGEKIVVSAGKII